MGITAQIVTAEQLLHASDIGPCELVRGELVMVPPAAYGHGRIANRIAAALTNFVTPRHLGDVVVSEPGFQIAHDPDTVRVPDVAFVRAERAPSERASGFFQGAPDLAVEVISSSDRASEVSSKVRDWLEAGCRMVWVVDPRNRTVSVYRSRSEVNVLGASHTLSGGDLLPGFSRPVAGMFAA